MFMFIAGKIGVKYIKIVVISAIGDMEKMDEFCCRYPKGHARFNRRCNITRRLASNPLQACYEIDQNSIKRHVKKIQTTINHDASYDTDEKKNSAKTL